MPEINLIIFVNHNLMSTDKIENISLSPYKYVSVNVVVPTSKLPLTKLQGKVRGGPQSTAVAISLRAPLEKGEKISVLRL